MLFMLPRLLQQASRTFKLVQKTVEPGTSSWWMSFKVSESLSDDGNHQTAKRCCQRTLSCRPRFARSECRSAIGRGAGHLQLADVVESFNVVTVITQQDTNFVSMLCHVVVISIALTMRASSDKNHLLIPCETPSVKRESGLQTQNETSPAHHEPPCASSPNARSRTSVQSSLSVRSPCQKTPMSHIGIFCGRVTLFAARALDALCDGFDADLRQKTLGTLKQCLTIHVSGGCSAKRPNKSPVCGALGFVLFG